MEPASIVPDTHTVPRMPEHSVDQESSSGQDRADIGVQTKADDGGVQTKSTTNMVTTEVEPNLYTVPHMPGHIVDQEISSSDQDRVDDGGTQMKSPTNMATTEAEPNTRPTQCLSADSINLDSLEKPLDPDLHAASFELSNKIFEILHENCCPRGGRKELGFLPKTHLDIR